MGKSYIINIPTILFDMIFYSLGIKCENLYLSAVFFYILNETLCFVKNENIHIHILHNVCKKVLPLETIDVIKYIGIISMFE